MPFLWAKHSKMSLLGLFHSNHQGEVGAWQDNLKVRTLYIRSSKQLNFCSSLAFSFFGNVFFLFSFLFFFFLSFFFLFSIFLLFFNFYFYLFLFFIMYSFHLHFQCYPKSPPHAPPPTPPPTHSHFLALEFPCTEAYKVCTTNGPLFPLMAD